MSKFHLPLTAAISAAILAASGCNRERDWQASSDTRVCVDSSGKGVDDDRCRTGSPGIIPFHWYYIARGGYIPWFGHAVSGGSFVPGAGAYRSAPGSAPAGAVTRGGFGGIGGGHAGAGA
jgi:hypothetical protein